MSKVISFYFVFVVLVFPTLADDWSLFRGDAGASGVATVDLPETLQTAWEQHLEKGWFQATPIIVGNSIFIGSSEEGMLAFDLRNSKIQWKFPVEIGILSPAAYFDGSLFFGDTDGILYALNTETGKERWRFQTGGCIDNSPNMDTKTKRVIIGSQAGTLYALESATGKLVWEYKTGDQIRCFPSIAERRCFVAGCDSKLHVVDLDSGNGIVQVELDAPTGSTPAVSGDKLFFGTEGNEFLAVDWKKGKIVWRFPMKQAVRAPAACRDGLVIFGGFDKTVYALDAETGKERWQYKTKGRIEGGTLIVGNRVYVPSADSGLYVFELTTGKFLNKIGLSGKLLAAPAAAVNSLVIGTDDGGLYRLNQELRP